MSLFQQLRVPVFGVLPGTLGYQRPTRGASPGVGVHLRRLMAELRSSSTPFADTQFVPRHIFSTEQSPWTEKGYGCRALQVQEGQRADRTKLAD